MHTFQQRPAVSVAGIWLATLISQPALATELIWLEKPSDPALIEELSNTLGAVSGDAIDLRSAAVRITETDADAYSALAQTLRDARDYEVQLDGEKLIMAEVGMALDQIDLIRNEGDRNQIFAALTYQGFAVDRYYAEDLATDPQALPYRIEWEAEARVGPWLQAIAVEPQREVTPYEIAEAPERVRYETLRVDYQSALPATLVPVDLPEGHAIFVDGRPAELSAAGTIRVLPGRHYAHVTLDGRVIARQRFDLAPGDQVQIDDGVMESEWQDWLSVLKQSNREGPPPPAGLKEALDALGGEVWVALANEKGKRPVVMLRKVTIDGAGPAEVAQQDQSRPGAAPDGFTVTAHVHGGWMSTADFYFQNPEVAPLTSGTVNSLMGGLGVEVARDIGSVRVGAGAMAQLTVGAHHVARYGESSTRVRLFPHFIIGIRPAQLLVGYQLPHHLSLGAQATVPVSDGLELRAGALYGLAMPKPPEEGTWQGAPLYTAWGGVGWRFGG